MTTTLFYVWPLWCACSFSGCEWAYCHGTLLCRFSKPKCGGVLGANDQNRAEKQNVVLTWFRPVTWSSGHLGRRKFPFFGMYFFLVFGEGLGRPTPIFFLFFLPFSGRRPETYSVAGQRDGKPRPKGMRFALHAF